MFCVIYEFEVMEKDETMFKEIWHNLTHIIKETRGGLGSRLHKDNTKENVWVAYAQWPCKSTWNQPSSFNNSDQEKLKEQMKEVCKNIRTIYQLDMVDDMLVHPFN